MRLASHARHLERRELLEHLSLEVSSLREACVHDNAEALAGLQLRDSRFHAGRSPDFFERAIQ